MVADAPGGVKIEVLLMPCDGDADANPDGVKE